MFLETDGEKWCAMSLLSPPLDHGRLTYIRPSGVKVCGGPVDIIADFLTTHCIINVIQIEIAVYGMINCQA